MRRRTEYNLLNTKVQKVGLIESKRKVDEEFGIKLIEKLDENKLSWKLLRKKEEE